MEGGGSRRKARAVRPREAARVPAGRDSLALGDRGSGGPGRPGQARGESGGHRPAPRPPAAPRARGRPGQVVALPASGPPRPRPPLRGRLSHRPGLRRGPAKAAPACEQRANEAGAQRRAAGAGVRRAAEEGRRLMNINRAAA